MAGKGRRRPVLRADFISLLRITESIGNSKSQGVGVNSRFRILRMASWISSTRRHAKKSRGFPGSGRARVRGRGLALREQAARCEGRRVCCSFRNARRSSLAAEQGCTRAYEAFSICRGLFSDV